MIICLINKKSGICENIVVCENLELAKTLFLDYDCVEIEKGFGIGDVYKNNEWSKANKVKTEEELNLEYENLACLYIHQKYSYDDENKIIREFLAGQNEEAFNEYNEFVIECKARAHNEVYGN